MPEEGQRVGQTKDQDKDFNQRKLITTSASVTFIYYNYVCMICTFFLCF